MNSGDGQQDGAGESSPWLYTSKADAADSLFLVSYCLKQKSKPINLFHIKLSITSKRCFEYHCTAV
jgi:hypothetical protein